MNGGVSIEQKSVEIYAIYLMDEVYDAVLNRPKAGMSNFSKPYQIEKLYLKRLKIVEGYILAGSRLCDRVSGRDMIYKSVSAVRSIVKRVEKRDYYRWIKEPVLFQDLLVGKNIRVHVIGSSVIACHCEAMEVDYRYAKSVKIKRIELPEWLKKECIDVTKQLEFEFSGIDLIKRGTDYYILEVNPAPGYGYFDVDLCISKTLHCYLTKALKE